MPNICPNCDHKEDTKFCGMCEDQEFYCLGTESKPEPKPIKVSKKELFTRDELFEVIRYVADLVVENPKEADKKPDELFDGFVRFREL